MGKMIARLNQLNGLERLWLVGTVLLCVVSFAFFLGDPAIYDSSTLVGPDAERWLYEQKAEWGWRCIPGTWREGSFLAPRFSCYSIFVDGLPALLGAGGVALASYATLKITRWVIGGFK